MLRSHLVLRLLGQQIGGEAIARGRQIQIAQREQHPRTCIIPSAGCSAESPRS